MGRWHLSWPSRWALYSFCKHPDCFCDAIATAIRCGGDVDTTAAMTGALLGVRIGFDGVPVVWRNVVHDVDDWTLTELVALIGTVFALVLSQPSRSIYGYVVHDIDAWTLQAILHASRNFLCQ